MITGDEPIDSGSIILDSINLSENLRTAQRRMGYCPQFDALIDLLTGEETLYMFARLRGVKSFLIPPIVNSLIELMSLQKHAKKPIYAYSGGNKRKLSAAVALIGDPSIILLDEPTTGMDPKARRHFWNAIAQIRDHGKPIILTSHSMEECEALCTRLAIMVNGKFKCLGSIQHLKSKFGAGKKKNLNQLNSIFCFFIYLGYTLMAKLKVFDDNRINGFYSVIKNSFPNSQLKEAYEGFVHIHINETSLSLAQLFRIIETCKQTYSIENYTVSQTTLEQVFLNFARSQIEVDETRHRTP
jgi:ATP-binding cassette subfamily A (ABC1) protein 3